MERTVKRHEMGIQFHFKDMAECKSMPCLEVAYAAALNYLQGLHDCKGIPDKMYCNLYKSYRSLYYCLSAILDQDMYEEYFEGGLD